MTEIDLISINVNSNLHSVFSKEKNENLDSKNMHLAVASKKQEKRSKGRTQLWTPPSFSPAFVPYRELKYLSAPPFSPKIHGLAQFIGSVALLT